MNGNISLPKSVSRVCWHASIFFKKFTGETAVWEDFEIGYQAHVFTFFS